MAVALLDSSALLAYVLRDDTLHRSAAEAIEHHLRAGTGGLAMSAVTWSEVSYGILRGLVPEEAVVEFIDDFNIDALPVDAYTAERASHFQKAYRDTGRRSPWPRLRTPDALILATADTNDDITTVIAGDAQWPKVPGVRADVVLLREHA